MCFWACVAWKCCRAANDKVAWPQWGGLIGWRIAQIVLGWLIYCVSAYPFMGEGRTLLLNWAAQPWLQIHINLGAGAGESRAAVPWRIRLGVRRVVAVRHCGCGSPGFTGC